MKKRFQQLPFAAFILLLFSFMFLWFTKIHPLIPFDGDDWTYLGYFRPAVPLWGAWNPSRVFPEVALPFLSTVASYLLMPLTKDYITAQTLMHAFIVSAFITGYLVSFASLLRRCFSVSRLTASLLTVLFLVLHFLAMRSAQSDNQYLLYCINLTCYYYYMIPSLINASIVMCLIRNEKMSHFLKDGPFAAKGCFYVFLYFAIFSNLPSSGILAVYAGCVLLLDILRRLKARRWSGLLPENGFYWGILLAWLVSAVFELNGGRADYAPGGSSLFTNLPSALRYLAKTLLKVNGIFLLFALSVLLIAAIVLILSRGKGKGIDLPKPDATLFAMSFVVYSVYILTLCTAVNPECLQRNEYLFGSFFFGLMLVMLAITFLVCRFPRIMLVLPLLIVFLASDVDTEGKTFRESYRSDLPPSVCVEISRDLVSQVQEASRQGAMETDLYVPMYVTDPENQDNWPHTLPLMDRISDTLYANGLIDKPVYVRTVADLSMNVKYHIPFPEE